jgi:predicted dehydrogenase
MEATDSSRRDFVKSTAIAAGAGAIASRISTTAYAAGSVEIKIGLVGCGGRGTGAAVNALNADPDVKLVAMGDAFKDRLESSLGTIKGDGGVNKRVDVPAERQFVGLEAYKQVIDAVDVVLLTTSPYFRPTHLAYAVEKGKHAFVEKPVATDGPGLRAMWDTVQKAKEKKLAVVSGLCWRYHQPKKETMQRVLDGEIGDIVACETVYNTGTLWHRGNNPNWTPMEYQIRNWLYFSWLSGDHITEQAIHSLDKMGWAMKDQPPASCYGVGGRQVRTGAEYGNIYDHFGLIYEYPGGVRGYHMCRQMSGAYNRVEDYIFGTKGTAHVFQHKITGEKPWQYKGPSNDMYQTEHVELFKSIRDGNPINNGEYMCRSTGLATLGRMAAYTGQAVTWEQMWNSQEALGPAKIELGPAPQHPVAMPGETKIL